MSKAIQGEGVTVNCVSPGVIITPSMIEMGLEQGMGESVEEIEAAMDQMMGSSSPLGRMGRINEIADVVLFIASPLASYIHGANIRVDGGYVPTIN